MSAQPVGAPQLVGGAASSSAQMSLDLRPEGIGSSEERPHAEHEAREPSRSRKPSFVRFVDDASRERLCEEAWRARALIARPSPALPGKLGRVLEAAIESALARRGAMPPIGEVQDDPTWAVSDQLFRAAALPVREILICVPPLRSLADRGRLRDDDATVLMSWIDAAKTETRLAVGILIEEADRDIELKVPRPLDEVVWDAGAGSLVSMVPRVAERSTDLSPPPVAPTLRPDSAEAEGEATSSEVDDGDEGQDLAEVIAAAEETKLPDLVLAVCPAVEEVEPESSIEEREALRAEAERIEAERAIAEREESDRLEAERAEAARVEAERIEAERVQKERREAERREAERKEAERREALRLEAERKEAERKEAERIEAERAERLLVLQGWREHAMELDAARGPRPAAQVERLFTERYIPLLGAIHRGETDAAIRDIVRGWRDGFAESYEAAFGTIRVTGKRPTMVMDAPEVAHRVARLASARSVKLVLVDSMSFDLSERVAARLRASLDKRAVLVEKAILWSALPTTTPSQLHLLARGPQGLADMPPAPSEPDISRGRNVAAFRRERLGAREIMKLDLVEARLRGTGPTYDERLDAIAEELAEGLLKLFESMPPRTLVYVFGDHGFVLGAGQNGWATGPSVQGGASPEEVLVGGQAWLVDAVQ